VGQRVRIRIRTRSVRRRFWGHVEQVGGATMPALGASGGRAPSSRRASRCRL